MKCHSLRDAIVEQARGGTIGPGTAAAIESHLEHCAACAALMTRERQLSEGLRALAASAAAEEPSDALGQRLLEVFAERHAIQRRPGMSAAGPWMRVAAAVTLVAAAAALWWGVRSGPAKDNRLRPQVAAAGQPGPVQAPDAGVAPADPARQTLPAATTAGRPRGARQRNVRAAPVVRATGFVSIPGTDGLPDFESGEIVRVEIPLTSLPTYGIEILPDARRTPVAADLLVGQDGRARAIRLVHAGDGS
jgi:hypothetical protein